MEDIRKFRRFDTPELHFLSSSAGHGDFSDLRPAEKAGAGSEKLTWIHLRYFPPGLILESLNEVTKKKTERPIDLLTFTQFSNLEATAKELMTTEPLFTLHNKPTLVQCLEKLKFRCKPDYRKRYSLRASIKTHSLPVIAAAISRKGDKFATGSYDKTCKVWSSSTNEEIMSLDGHYDAVCVCSFNTHGDKMLTGSYDSTIRVWRLDEEKRQGEWLHTLQGATSEIQAVEYSPDCHLAASGSTDQMARVYDLTSGLSMYTLKGHDGDVNNVEFERSCQTLLTGSLDSKLGRWDLRSGKLIEFLPGHTAEVIKCSFDFLGEKVVSCSADTNVKLWDLRNTTSPLATFTENMDEVWDVKFNSRGSLISSVSKDGKLLVWDVATCKRLVKVQAHKGPVRQVTFNSAGSLLLTCGDDKMARLWTPDTGDCSQTLEGHTDKVTHAFFNYFGDTILTVGKDCSSKIWQ